MRTFLVAGLACLACACAEESGPPLIAANVSITQGPSSQMSAAYLDLTNNGHDTIVITHVASPEFDSVVMHETMIEDDIVRMRPLEKLSIAPGKSTSFERGGKHLMLLRPHASTGEVTLQFYAGDSMLLSVRAVSEPAVD